MRKPQVVSLFTGVGGLDVGFAKAGFETAFATDVWDLSCESYARNFPQTEILVSDIASINFKRLKRRLKVIDGLIGGPPCPAFSKSRFYLKDKNRGMSDEIGYKTLTHYFRAIEELKPKFFFFENVHGFVYKPHKSAFEFLVEESERLGYQVTFSVVNAADYGVGQNRARFICVGTRKKMTKFLFPNPTHSDPSERLKGTKPWITCGDLLDDIDFDLPEDKQMQAGSKHKHLLRKVPPGDNYLFFTKERGHPKPVFRWRSRYWSFLLKLSKERPSWTIQASHSNNMGPFHWKNRFLRIPEIMRLQSFGDDYIVLGKYKERWRQIGNAVPPRLAYCFAKQIKTMYFE